MTCQAYGGGNCNPPPSPKTVVTVPSTTPKTHAAPLPFTGGDVAGLALVGALVLAAGISLLGGPARSVRVEAALRAKQDRK